MDSWAIPVNSEDFTGSKFMSDLYSRGFDRYIRFSADMRGKVITALALGIMRHFSVDYQSLPEKGYVEKTWKEKIVNTLVALHSERKASYSSFFRDIAYNDESFNSVESWKRIREVIRDKLIELFTYPLKKEWALRVLHESDDVDFDQIDVMEDIAIHLRLNIILVEPGENSLIMKAMFFKEERALIFPVVLARDEEKNVYLLYHPDPDTPLKKVGLPFIMDPRESVEDFYNIKAIRPPPDIAAVGMSQEKLLTYRYNITAALANLLSAVCSNGIPSNCLSEFEDLKTVVNTFLPMISVTDERPGYVDDLKEIIELKEVSEPQVEDHTLNNCYQIPNVQDRLFKLPCGHVYHTTCLQRYLVEKAEQAAWDQNPTIFCPEHRVPIPPVVLKTLDAEVYGRLEERKRNLRKAHLGTG